MNIIAFFEETFLKTNAGLSILQGLWTTVRISVVSLLLGTLLAVPLCALRMSGRRAFAIPAKAVTAVLRGTPVLMLLMLFYYVVFAASRVDAVIIAIIVFSIHTAVHVQEIMVSALHSVPPGQAEAARALGMGRVRAFMDITLPQAWRVAMPVYQSAVVNLIQWTSVVGYVSITDLTRAINFITSRTLEPLFMLFVGIALYLLMAGMVSLAFWLLGRRKSGISYRYEKKGSLKKPIDGRARA